MYGFTAVTSSPKLEDFLSYLSGLSGRPDPAELARCLDGLDLSPDDLGAYVRFNEEGYARNLIFESEIVQLLCLCWRSGQRSPIHDHARSLCGVRIVSGLATETRFERVASGYIKAVCSEDYPVGTVMVSQNADTHQISNLQGEGTDLVTLHVYAPPLNRMKTYTIESRETSEYRPCNREALVDGGGI